MDTGEISASSLHARQGEKNLQLIDVREPDEWAAGHLPGAIHVPLGGLEDRLPALAADAPTVVYCRSGGRSRRAQKILQAHGFARVDNLTGGVLAYAAEVGELVR